MGKKVAITGIGQTRTKLKRKDVNFPELMGEACRAALQDAGLSIDQIDCVVCSSSPEFFEGLSEPEMWATDFTFGVLKPHYRIQTGGTVGASTTIAGWYLATSGMYNNVLVVSGDKLTEGSVQKGLSMVYSPTMGRDFAAGAPSAVACQTRVYMNKYPQVSDEHFARIGTMMRRNALNNPHATLKLPQITEEMMLNMAWLSTPFRLLDSCPTSDAACAMILQSDENALANPRPRAWIQAVSTVADGVNYPDRDWSDPIALKKAARTCYEATGIKNPLEDLDVVEIYDAFTSQHLIWLEGLGLCEPGRAAPDLIDSGAIAMDGKLPVNPSGGVLSNNSIGGSAMIRQAEVALQIMNRAGDRQVPGAEIGLAHGWGGAIQFHTVMILSGEKEMEDSFRKRAARR
ncbi:MAG: thiolase domain-containing protein [Spirochaetales bacterium]|nr:thiolase domain-containing protein [Spirochaetales bacterium]